MLFQDRAALVRTVLTMTASSLLSLLWGHAVAAVVRDAFDLDEPIVAVPLTLAAVLAGLTGGIAARHSTRSAALVALATGGVTVLVTSIAVPGAPLAMASVLLVAPVAAAVGRWLQCRVPETWVRQLAAPWSVGALGLGAVVTVVQFARLAAHVADPSVAFVLSTADPFWAEHECLPAYVHAAELAGRGDPNVWDAAHYPGIDPTAEPHTALTGMVVEDPYQYTPQFLLLPYLALSLTDAYPTIRRVWFALQVTIFLGTALGLLGGLPRRHAAMGLLALPFALTGFATLWNFQYGQVHLLAIALATAAMLAFDEERDTAGGALLAFAILAKLFPAILLVPLVAMGRYRALGWTLGFVAAASVATLAVFGGAPFEAFVTYHLPRLQSGEAVAFWKAWPEAVTLILSANQGPFGIVLKLGALGVPGMGSATAAAVSTAFVGGVGIASYFVGRRMIRASAEAILTSTLGLLGLASLASPGAFGDYVPAAGIWLLTLAAGRLAALSRPQQLGVGVIALSQYTVFGAAPLGSWSGTPLLAASLGTAVGLLAVFAWPVFAILRREGHPSLRDPRSGHVVPAAVTPHG
ncbi:MAG: glycosyltransferase family 87 protein [Myxococcota bacterium]